jgi:NDP-sugar pyrophosphorylase family protein
MVVRLRNSEGEPPIDAEDHVNGAPLRGLEGIGSSMAAVDAVDDFGPPARAVVLAGGRGVRLAPFTSIFPKPLMPLGEEPILGVLLRQLAGEGFTDVTLAVGYMAELIKTFCGDGSRFGVRLSYSVESTPLGTVGPLVRIEGLDSTFLVMNGDLLTTLSFGAFLAHHRRSGAALTLGSVRRDSRMDFGVLDLESHPNGGARVINMREKPVVEAVVSMGVYAMEPRALEYIDRDRAFDLPELVLRLLAAGEHVEAKPFDGYWLDIGRHSDYERACEEFATIRSHLLPNESPSVAETPPALSVGVG